MKAYKATIFHAGKQNHQIVKDNLSASEIIILKAVHGSHAVMDIYDMGSEKIIKYIKQEANGREVDMTRPSTMVDEKDFLTERYGQQIFSATFPGAVPVLPTDLAQVGIEYVEAGHTASIEKIPENTSAPSEDDGEGDAESGGETSAAAVPEKKSKLPKFLGGN